MGAAAASSPSHVTTGRMEVTVAKARVFRGVRMRTVICVQETRREHIGDGLGEHLNKEAVHPWAVFLQAIECSPHPHPTPSRAP